LITTKIEGGDLDSRESSPEEACLVVLKSPGQFDSNNKYGVSNGVNVMDGQ
jgi:hypothetical protein